MGIGGWVLAIIATAIAVVGALQARATAKTYRPLASRQPQQPGATETPLGLEAIDQAEIARTARRNDSLERTNRLGFGSKRHPMSFTQAAATDIPAKPDTENYAAWFHAAFNKDKPKDT